MAEAWDVIGGLWAGGAGGAAWWLAAVLVAAVRRAPDDDEAGRLAELEADRTALEQENVTLLAEVERLQHALRLSEDRRETEVAAAEAAVQQHTERLRAFSELQRILLATQPLVDIAEAALHVLDGLVPLTRSSVLVLGDDVDEVRVLAASVREPSATRTGHRYPRRVLEGPRAEADEIVYLEDLRALTDLSVLEQVLYVEGLRSLVQVPLAADGVLFGFLHVGSACPFAFSPEHVDVAREVGALLSMSLHRHRLERARRHYEDELVAGKRRAEELARMKTSFLANMTHETRTPLSSIIGFADLLRDDVEPPQRELVEDIQECAQKLLTTINAVLDLARLESNRTTLDCRPLDVGREVAAAARLLQPLARRKGLVLEVEDAAQGAAARLERTALGRVLNNLIGNALKFTEEGGVTLGVAADAEHVRIEVRDTGIGIADAFLPHLFEEFRQESSGMSRTHEGTGLGLAITRRLVELMDGTIAVQSTKGEGSVFTVQFGRVG